MKKSGGRYTRYKVSYSWEGDCEMGENKMPHIQLPENLGCKHGLGGALCKPVIER